MSGTMSELTDEGFETFSGHVVQWPDLDDGIRVLDSDGNCTDIYRVDSGDYKAWMARFADALPKGIKPLLESMADRLSESIQNELMEGQEEAESLSRIVETLAMLSARKR